MSKHMCLFFTVVLLTAGVVSVSIAGEPQKKPSGKAISIEGTYKLVSRKLPDGRMLGGDDVIGLQTFTKTYRNFNVAWKDSSGKYFTLSVASTYKLTPAEYTETVLSSSMNDEIGGKGVMNTMKGESKTVPVTTKGGSIALKLPFDPVSVVFEGNKFVATNEGVFVDTWEKVK